MVRSTKVLCCLVLALSTLAVYLPVLRHDFLNYDDQQYVIENPVVRSGLTGHGFVWAFGYHAGNWHPLTWLSHQLDCQLFGIRAWGHHLTNVLLHTANTVLLFLLLGRLTGATWRSAAVAALFGWHPLHVESVAWVSERKDLLSALFFLLTLWAYAGYAGGQVASVKCQVSGARCQEPKGEGERRNPFSISNLQGSSSRAYWFAGALGFFALALMSKPMAVTLPFVLLLLDYWPLRRFVESSKFKVQSSKLTDESRLEARAPGPGDVSEVQRSPTPKRSPAHPLTRSPTLLRLLAEKLPFLALSAAACVLTLSAQQPAIVSTAGLSVLDRLGHALLAYTHYLGALFAPHGMAVYYPYQRVVPPGQVFISGALLTTITVLFLWGRSRARAFGVVRGPLTPALSPSSLRSAATEDGAEGEREKPSPALARAAMSPLPLIGGEGQAEGVERRGYLVTGWFWFLGMLVPVIGLVQVGDQAWADRYTYLPSVGLFIAAVWGVADLYTRLVAAGLRPNRAGVSPSPPLEERAGERRPPAAGDPCRGIATVSRSLDEEKNACAGQASAQPKHTGLLSPTLSSRGGEGERPAWILRVGLYASALLVAASLLTSTSIQLSHWKNTRTLFEHTAKVTRNNPLAETILASLLEQEGKLDQAIARYRAVLGYAPGFPEAHFFLGHALDQQGKLDEAVAEYQKALWFKPMQEQTHIFLGAALAKQQKTDAAAAHYAAALKLNPNSAVAHNNMAKLLHAQGRLDEALDHYSRAVKLDPDLAQAHNNFGILLLQKGRLAEGIAELRQALRLKPGDAESQLNLAQALVQQEHWSEAAELFGKAVTPATADRNARCQYATALAHLRKTREAMSQYAGALLLQSDFPAALDGLAWILSTAPEAPFRNGAQAVGMAERACELTGRKDPAKLKTLAAAYAETGRFAEAVVTAQRAMDLASAAGHEKLAKECRKMLDQFRASKPWRAER